MPETYYYATGTEITSIADAIRNKGGISDQLEFPDDFAQVIENLQPEATIAPLTVSPMTMEYKHPTGFKTINYVYIHETSKTVTMSVDLSEFSNGDVCYVKGGLYMHTGVATNHENLDGSFVWSNSNTYTKGIYTLNISSASVTISANYSGSDYMYADSDGEVGYELIGFCKKIDCDGFGPVTVEKIPNGYVNVSDTTATAADIVSGKTAGIKYGNYGTIATGTLVIQHYYTGSSDPSSSLGVNGDIYLKT